MYNYELCIMNYELKITNVLQGTLQLAVAALHQQFWIQGYLNIGRDAHTFADAHTLNEQRHHRDIAIDGSFILLAYAAGVGQRIGFGIRVQEAQAAPRLHTYHRSV